MRYSGFPLAIAGLRANNTPCQTPLCPKRRPPRPQQPIFGVFQRGGLHFERHTASRRGFTTTKRECCIIRTPARRQPAPNSVKSHRHRCGGCRRNWWAWLRRSWAAAGPGRASRRRAEQRQPPQPYWCGGRGRNWWVCCGAGGRRRGLDGIRTERTNTTGVEGAGGIRGPGCSARGRRRGLAGLRDDAPSNVSHHSPTGVEGAGGPGGPGRASRRGAERSEDAKSRGRPGSPAPGTPVGRAQQPGTPVGRAQQPGTPVGHTQQPGTPGGHAQQPGPAGTREIAGARSAAAPRAPHLRASVAHRLSWMLRPGTASISSRV